MSCRPTRLEICAARGMLCNPATQRCVHPDSKIGANLGGRKAANGSLTAVATIAQKYWHTGKHVDKLLAALSSVRAKHPEFVVVVLGMLLASILRISGGRAKDVAAKAIASLGVLGGNVKAYVAKVWRMLFSGPPPPPPPPTFTLPQIPAVPTLPKLPKLPTSTLAALLDFINLVMRYPSIFTMFFACLVIWAQQNQLTTARANLNNAEAITQRAHAATATAKAAAANANKASQRADERRLTAEAAAERALERRANAEAAALNAQAAAVNAQVLRNRYAAQLALERRASNLKIKAERGNPNAQRQFIELHGSNYSSNSNYASASPTSPRR